MSTNLNPEIYVACLASYNSGIIFGCWVNAEQDEDSIHEEIQHMLAKSTIPNAEEYAIHGYSDFGSLSLSENESLSTVHDLAIFIKEHGELGAELIAYLGDLESAQNALENNYHGQHYNELNFAIELFEECYFHDIPENLRSYIDYEAFRLDLFMTDYYSIKVEYETHIFSIH